MSIRRRLMLQVGKSDPYDNMGYIKAGKIFHLDGINKGDTEGAWTDLVGGIVYTNYNVTAIENGWSFPGTNGVYLGKSGTQFSPSANRTIEVCFYNKVESTLFLFVDGSSTTNNICLIIDKTYKALFLQNQQTYNFFPTKDNPHCVSLNLDKGLYDGSEVQKSTSTYWGSSDYSYIGRRNRTGNPYNGYIYSIRIYDRRLSAAEMLHNQQVDNERFNLGLDI